MHDEVIAEFRLRAEAALSFVDNTEKAGPFTLATSARSRLSGSGASRQEPGDEPAFVTRTAAGLWPLAAERGIVSSLLSHGSRY